MPIPAIRHRQPRTDHGRGGRRCRHHLRRLVRQGAEGSCSRAETDRPSRPVETPDTSGGGYPSLAVNADGSHVFLAWYDLKSQDLLVGIQGEVDDLLVAQPSPTPEAPPTSAGPAVECPKDGIPLIAPPGAAAVGFDVTELTAPADESFTICFDNQDPTVPHNVDVFDSPGRNVARGGEHHRRTGEGEPRGARPGGRHVLLPVRRPPHHDDGHAHRQVARDPSGMGRRPTLE